MKLKIALVQLNVSDDVRANLISTERAIRQAANMGAQFVLTPENTNFICVERKAFLFQLATEDADPTLAMAKNLAAELGIWLLVGSLALAGEKPGSSHAVNRSFLISSQGEIVGRYDKIHLFDAELGDGDEHRESARFYPGSNLCLANTPWGSVGMSICYDIRFPHLYRQLAMAGASILTVPAAFTVDTGRAHWQTLCRARAIENGCFVLAPGQSGVHAQKSEALRKSWGHSLAIDPWGNILAAAGEEPTIALAKLEMEQVADARRAIPSLVNGRKFTGP